MADSAGGKLEWPGLPDTLSSRVAVPFSEMPTLASKQSVAYNFGQPVGMDYAAEKNVHFYIVMFNRLIKKLCSFQTWHVRQDTKKWRWQKLLNRTQHLWPIKMTIWQSQACYIVIFFFKKKRVYSTCTQMMTPEKTKSWEVMITVKWKAEFLRSVSSFLET
jgi:hypothetical protein